MLRTHEIGEVSQQQQRPSSMREDQDMDWSLAPEYAGIVNQFHIPSQSLGWSRYRPKVYNATHDALMPAMTDSPPFDPHVVDIIVDYLQPSLHSAFIPVLKAMQTDDTLPSVPVAASKIRGTPYLLPGESWPLHNGGECARLGTPLPLWLQLRVSDLPDLIRSTLPPPSSTSETLLQFFFCSYGEWDLEARCDPVARWITPSTDSSFHSSSLLPPFHINAMDDELHCIGQSYNYQKAPDGEGYVRIPNFPHAHQRESQCEYLILGWQETVDVPMYDVYDDYCVQKMKEQENESQHDYERGGLSIMDDEEWGNFAERQGIKPLLRPIRYDKLSGFPEGATYTKFSECSQCRSGGRYGSSLELVFSWSWEGMLSSRFIVAEGEEIRGQEDLMWVHLYQCTTRHHLAARDVRGSKSHHGGMPARWTGMH